MVEANLEKDIKSMVAEILEMQEEEIDPNANFVQDLGMDSMMALEVLAGLEKKYKIAIPEESLQQFESLNKTVNIVKDIYNNR